MNQSKWTFHEPDDYSPHGIWECKICLSVFSDPVRAKGHDRIHFSVQEEYVTKAVDEAWERNR